jgi:hypothetical protein
MNSNKTTKLSTLSIVKASLFPAKLVFLEQDRASNDKFVRATGNNHVILNLMKSGDEEKVNNIKEELTKIKELRNKAKAVFDVFMIFLKNKISQYITYKKIISFKKKK